MRLIPEAARERFLTARVARLATVGADGVPHLVPVTFAVIEIKDEEDSEGGAGAPTAGTAEVIVFGVDHNPKSTTALRRLANIAAEPRVAFLVDHYDGDWSALWWVRADAVARIVNRVHPRAAVQALAHRYPQYAAQLPEGPVVGSWVTGWSGWQAGDVGQR